LDVDHELGLAQMVGEALVLPAQFQPGPGRFFGVK